MAHSVKPVAAISTLEPLGTLPGRSRASLDLTAWELRAVEAQVSTLAAVSPSTGMCTTATLAAIADISVLQRLVLGSPAATAAAAASIGGVDHTAYSARFRIAGCMRSAISADARSLRMHRL
jgi:hypothetical protein